MKTIYYIDENCRDRLELMPALRDILLHEGTQDVKVAVTASEFFHHTGFRAKDKDIYFDASEASSSSTRRAFLTRHKDMMEILPVYENGFAAEYEEVFLRLIAPYLRKDNPEPLPADVETEIRRNAAHVIAKYAPELTTATEPAEALAKRIDLTLNPDDPASERHDTAIIAACMRSGKLLSILKKREQERFDSELPTLLLDFIGPQKKNSLPPEVQEEVLENAKHLFSHTPARNTVPAVDETIGIYINPGDAIQEERNAAIIHACKQSNLTRKWIKSRNNERYQALFSELLQPFLQPGSGVKMPDDVESEVRKIAAEHIKHNATHLTSPDEKASVLAKRLKLQLDPTDENAEMNQILLTACRQSQALRRYVRNHYEDRFEALFKELLTQTLSKGTQMPADVLTEIRKNVTSTIHRIEGKAEVIPSPILKDDAIDLSIDPSDASRGYHDSIIIEACRQSKQLTDHLKKQTRNYTVMTDDLADREMFSHIKKILRPQNGDTVESPTTKFVVVTDDEPFADKLKKHLFKGSGKDSVCMSSDEFLDYCGDKIASLRAQAARANRQTTKAAPKTDKPITETPQAQADQTVTQLPAIDPPAAARISTALALASALQQQHEKLHRSKPPEPKPSKPVPQQEEPERRKRYRQRSAERESPSPSGSTPIRTLPKRRPAHKLQLQPRPEPKAEPAPSHEPDFSKLDWHEYHAHVMQLTPEQRKAQKLETPRDEYAKGLECLKQGEIHYIKSYDTIEEMRSQSPHPHFMIAKRLPKPDSVEYRVGALCKYVSEVLEGEQRQKACASLNTLLNLEGEAAITPENLNENKSLIISKINKLYISKSVTFEGFLKKLSAPLGDNHPLSKYQPPAADKPLPSNTPCLIKNQVPEVVREVLAEEMKLGQADLNKITITEQGSNYRIDLPVTLEASEQSTRKPAGLCAKRMSQKLGVKVRHYQPNKHDTFAQPVLFLPVSISKEMGIDENSAPNAIRDMIQMSLGLKDDQMHGFSVSQKNTYFRVRIPALTHRYDAQTGDPDYASNGHLHIVHEPQDAVASAISESHCIPIMNTPEIPIFERNFKFAKKSAPPPPRVVPMPEPVVDVHKPDPDRLSLLDAMAYYKSHPSEEGKEMATESDELAMLRRGAIIYAKVPAPPAPAPEKPRIKPRNRPPEVQDKVNPGDTIAPYLYFSDMVTRRHLASQSIDLADQKSTEIVRDMLAFTLGLQPEQAQQFKVERSATPGMLKVRLPSLTFHYDEKTGESVATAGEGVRSETFTPEQVADMLSSQDSLAVPVLNSRETAVVDSKIKLPAPAPKAEPAALPKSADTHALDPNRLPLHEKFFISREFSAKQRRHAFNELPAVQQMHFSNIWFLKNGESTEPYLFVPYSARAAIGAKTDEELESAIQDVLRATLGLKYHQIATFKLEKCTNTPTAMYKMRIRPVTYINEEGPEPVFDTMSALEVAKHIEEHLGTRIVGSINHANREQHIALVSPRDWVGAVAPKKTEPAESEPNTPKPTRLQRFTKLIRRTIDEAGARPERPYPFSVDKTPRTGRMGQIKRIKNEALNTEELYLVLPDAATQGLDAYHSAEQKCRDLCKYLAALGTEEQSQALAAIQKMLEIELKPNALDYAHDPLLAAIEQRHQNKPDAFELFLAELKTPGNEASQTFNRYHPPMHELGERLREILQTALDLSDAERDAIQFDTATFSREPCMVKLPSIAYTTSEPLPGLTGANQGALVNKVFTPDEVARALNNEFDIAVEGQETTGGAARSVRQRNTGGKHGR